MTHYTVDELLTHYLETRGMRPPIITSGKKILEEAEELVEAIDQFNHGMSPAKMDQIFYELGDCALVLANIARHFNIDVESCMVLKAKKDIGRGDPPGWSPEMEANPHESR